MEQKQHIDKLVEETLDSLDGIGRAKANPFLFTRVQARLQGGKSVWDRVTSYIARPAVALAMLCLVIVSNAAVLYWQAGSDETMDQGQLALTEEYSQTVSSFYEDVNPEP
jgi:phage-related minor tail protein